MFQYMEIEEEKVIVQSRGHMQIKFWLWLYFLHLLFEMCTHSIFLSVIIYPDGYH